MAISHEFQETHWKEKGAATFSFTTATVCIGSYSYIYSEVREKIKRPLRSLKPEITVLHRHASCSVCCFRLPLTDQDPQVPLRWDGSTVRSMWRRWTFVGDRSHQLLSVISRKGVLFSVTQGTLVGIIRSFFSPLSTMLSNSVLSSENPLRHNGCPSIYRWHFAFEDLRLANKS